MSSIPSKIPRLPEDIIVLIIQEAGYEEDTIRNLALSSRTFYEAYKSSERYILRSALLFQVDYDESLLKKALVLARKTVDPRYWAQGVGKDTVMEIMDRPAVEQPDSDMNIEEAKPTLEELRTALYCASQLRKLMKFLHAYVSMDQLRDYGFETVSHFAQFPDQYFNLDNMYDYALTGFHFVSKIGDYHVEYLSGIDNTKELRYWVKHVLSEILQKNTPYDDNGLPWIKDEGIRYAFPHFEMGAYLLHDVPQVASKSHPKPQRHHYYYWEQDSARPVEGWIYLFCQAAVTGWREFYSLLRLDELDGQALARAMTSDEAYSEDIDSWEIEVDEAIHSWVEKGRFGKVLSWEEGNDRRVALLWRENPDAEPCPGDCIFGSACRLPRLECTCELGQAEWRCRGCIYYCTHGEQLYRL